MTATHSKKEIILIVSIAIYNFGLLVFSVLWIFTNSFQCIKKDLTTIKGLELNELTVCSLFFAGMLGGAFYCLRAIYLRLAAAYSTPKLALVKPPLNPHPIISAGKPNEIFNVRVWSFWYFYRPWQGGVLALMIMCLINANLLVAKDVKPETIKSVINLVAIGFLSGFGSSEAMQKIQEIIAVVFAKSKAGEGK